MLLPPECIEFQNFIMHMKAAQMYTEYITNNTRGAPDIVSGRIVG